VFQPNYVRFQFLDFDSFCSDKFWAMLQRFMEQSQDERASFVVLDPDPEHYFYRNFGRFGAMEFSREASAADYRRAIQAGPASSAADALSTNSEVLVWLPPSLRWVVWGERSPRTMVLACEAGFQGISAATVSSAGMCLLPIEDALDIGAPGWSVRSERQRFAEDLARNYAGGRNQSDRAVARALEAAGKLIGGELGVIEACRTLSSLRHDFGAGFEDHFMTFVGIDSETDDLPVGPVRREWAPAALALKDVEIERCEQLYRPRAIEACQRLIGRLTPGSFR